MNEKDQVLKLFETGAEIEIIAAAMEMPRESVHAILYEGSPRYRSALTRGSGGDKPVVEEMLDIVTELARSSSNDFIRLSASKFVRDDLKGRRDAIQLEAGINTAAVAILSERLKLLSADRQKFLTSDANAISV